MEKKSVLRTELTLGSNTFAVQQFIEDQYVRRLQVWDASNPSTLILDLKYCPNEMKPLVSNEYFKALLQRFMDASL